VRAAAAISAAAVSGDRLGSDELGFAPSRLPTGGAYVFDVAQAAERGSAGSVTLILQTLVVPLALAEAASKIVVRGGTHVDVCTIAGHSPGADRTRAWPRPLRALERGPLRRIRGRSVAANLPAHIPQRMADRARASLADLGVPVDIEAQRVAAACPGAGIFLIADYEALAASFSAYGRLGPSEFTVPRPSGHLMTNAWTIGQFGVAAISIEQGAPCRVRVEPHAPPAS
jgi:RNA 3'-terminal phosphate cyclase (ATP)